MKDTYYLTTPIYYVNDVPHIGHAYTTVAADVLARWRRLNGDRVHLLTGTDEHGQKVARAAEERGLDPQAHCDDILPRWKEMLELLGISNDDFIRTTEDRHTARVQEFMQRLYDQGDLYKSVYSGPYCVRCEAYYSESELVDGDQCPIHRQPVERLEQENWFFRLSKYGPALLELYDSRPEFVQPDVRRNEVRAFVESGLEDISATRTEFSWGVPCPWDEGHIFYVWFDALLNYITAIGYGADDDAFARRWPADVHLIGKDILRFHAVYWPAMLIAAGVEVPRQVYAHGFLLVGGEKMGKSNATGIQPSELVDHFGRDCYRYYFLREISFGQDGTFSWESMEARYETDLANELGNLANRVLNMVTRYADAKVPDPSVAGGEPGPEEERLAADRQAAVEGMAEFDQLAFKKGLEHLWVLVRGVNRYVEATEPWQLNKRGETARLARVLYEGVDALRVIAVLVSPVMPDAAGKLWHKLGPDEPLETQRLPDAGHGGRTAVGATVERGELLFPKLPEEAGT
ncbi:methionine--tRNA ligase [Egibacter rhizosphaerae]|uniref:Methionine--tRNA ligase n=1 Tax=Egibacter rhizosphaerae TaxID=1670831 RepID=A0A411YIX3_9ACTN|nr:methionine--tRNA ligase [Egibacter rhizosphaerae]QBI21101.1 methionine--tRNA ligase [Egibacter rhizosphaerae]